MTKQEINSYIAEHLFGMTNTGGNGWHKQNEYSELYCPDYIFYYQQVLSELNEEKPGKNIQIQVAQLKPFCEITVLYNGGGRCAKKYNAFGETIGEAVCRAVVEYLQSRQIGNLAKN